MAKQKSNTTTSKTADGAAEPQSAVVSLPIAVQLYTLRTLKQSPDEILAAVAEAGYSGVELAGTMGLSATDLRALLDKHGLKVVSAHVSLADLEADLPGAIRAQKILGNDTLVVPWLSPELRGASAAAWTALGQRLGKLGRRCRMANMRLLYHNHDFEMAQIEGRPAIEWLLDAARPELLGFEPDLAWIVVGEQDAPAMLKTYAGRCPRVHVKDLGDNPDERGFADVGYGRLDWDSLLPAIAESGAEWLVVEHDQPTNPLESIRRSQAFLQEKMNG